VINEQAAAALCDAPHATPSLLQFILAAPIAMSPWASRNADHAKRPCRIDSIFKQPSFEQVVSAQASSPVFFAAPGTP
jgi:hypothetical protein